MGRRARRSLSVVGPMPEACAIRGYSYSSITRAARARLRLPTRAHAGISARVGRSVSFMRRPRATLLRAEPRGRAWLGRCLSFLVASHRRLVLCRLARAALDVLFPIAPRSLEAGIGLLTGRRHHLLDGSAGILMVIELSRGGALRLAEVGIALKVVGQR